MLVTVVDYGVGNLRSIAKSIEKANSENNLNYSVKISSDISEIKKADKLVLPGQGSFKACREGIKNIKGLDEELNESVISKKKPIYGICAGMQLFGTTGYEDEETSGLNWIEGDVTKIKSGSDNFIHSYEFVPKNKKVVSLSTNYGEEIVAAVCLGNIYGSQFHPEKSQDTGIKILTSFLKI